MNVLIFDMDGVLIDVSRSYRQTIQKTIQIYLNTCLGLKKGDWITDEVISLFKSVGGFNNDWDLTSGVLLYLLSTSGIPPSRKRKKFSSVREIITYLRKKSSRFFYNKTIQLRKKDFNSFMARIKTEGGGLRGVRRALKDSWDGWVYQSGNLDEENLIKRIFQEVYLGEKFTPYYHLPRLFYRGKGLYQFERLLIKKEILSSLREKIQMGIASGRPRFEAELALKRFHLLPYFKSVVTLDECEEEEARIFHSTGRRIKCSKPHPYSILRVVKEIGILNPHCGYVGDVVDDMLAAKAAKKELSILAIGFLRNGTQRNSLKQSLLSAGADFVIERPKELLSLSL